MKQATFVINIILSLGLVGLAIAVYPPAVLSVILGVAWRAYEYWSTEETQRGMKK